jgi:hypothetical protein
VLSEIKSLGIPVRSNVPSPPLGNQGGWAGVIVGVVVGVVVLEVGETEEA